MLCSGELRSLQYQICWVSAGEVRVDVCAGLGPWLLRVWGVFNSCSGGFSAGLIPRLC